MMTFFLQIPVPEDRRSLPETSSSVLKNPGKGNCPYPGCLYATHSTRYMKDHIRKHTGEKPYKCEKCPYKASQKSNLNTHVKQVHAEKRENRPFECPHCPYRATRNNHLQLHIVNRHGYLPNTEED